MTRTFSDMTPQDFEQEFRVAQEEYDDKDFLGHFWNCGELKRDKLLYILCSMMDGTAQFDIFANKVLMSSEEAYEKMSQMLAVGVED